MINCSSHLSCRHYSRILSDCTFIFHLLRNQLFCKCFCAHWEFWYTTPSPREHFNSLCYFSVDSSQLLPLFLSLWTWEEAFMLPPMCFYWDLVLAHSKEPYSFYLHLTSQSRSLFQLTSCCCQRSFPHRHHHSQSFWCGRYRHRSSCLDFCSTALESACSCSPFPWDFIGS